MEFLAPERLQHKISAHKRRPRCGGFFCILRMAGLTDLLIN